MKGVARRRRISPGRFRRRSEGFDTFDENLGGVGLGFDDLDDLVEEFLKGHGAGVGGLAFLPMKFGLDVGRMSSTTSMLVDLSW